MGDMTEPAPHVPTRITVTIGGEVSPEVAAVRHLWERRSVPPELANDQPRTIEEWFVFGEPGPGYPTYRFMWRSDEYADPEAAARAFIEFATSWVEGPHLDHRTVTYSEWEPVL